jgi:DNA-binding CsgD family transcriptional regulator
VTRPVQLAEASHAAGELLERTAQLAALHESLQTVRRSAQGRIVFVSGEAGVGKTALLRLFTDECGRSTRVLWGGCDPLFTPRPLGPLRAVAEDVGGDLEHVVESESLPHNVVAALALELRERSPTVFVLEDLHWADEATLDVLRLLARRGETVPALILASYRDDEFDRAHPLRIMVGELGTSPIAGRLKLAPLSLSAVAQLARPHGVDADELYRKTTGNPFFVVEALAADAEEIPDSVRDAVLARVARLGPTARELAETVAVVPPQAELWLLDALAREQTAGLDECLGAGVLTSVPSGVAFRHELARLAVEESVPPTRKYDLHRRALAALSDPPVGELDLARVAHHAEAAGDVEAVLRFAPAAAERARSLGAHREAAAQYERALHFGDRLPPAERAELLELRARECYLTDQYDEGIAALEQALEYRRALGDRLKEGDALTALSQFLWCPGRTAESERAARDAVVLLEQLPPGRTLARAYHNLAMSCEAASRSQEAIGWGERSLELAERLGDEELAHGALSVIADCRRDYSLLQECLERARLARRDQQYGGISIALSVRPLEDRLYSLASRSLETGLAFCSDRGLELYRLYLLAFRARLELDQGRWTEAADTAASVLRIPRTSTTPRIVSLAVLALVRARRGDPEVWPLLREAWALAEPTGELPRITPVARARAEAAWLEGDRDRVDEATAAPLELALECNARWAIGELAAWRRRAGLDVDGDLSNRAVEPYDLELAGDYEAAARAWAALGCAYEAALALAEVPSEKPTRLALEALQGLDARPAAAIVAKRLRERGVRDVPSGPRKAARENAAGLTGRELEVLGLVAEGMRNTEIAERLVLSQKTVDHHVSAILRKLGVSSRGRAAAEAVRRGLVGQDR